MADDIDVLGQSLLNRTRTSRKRQQKQNRRDQNIALGLNLLNKGVGYANTYLKNRADTFVNEQEDLVGQRIRQQQAINSSTQIMTDHEAAQAHPLGTVGWLAENKFAPIIKANFERDFDTSKYSEKDINSWIYDTAATEAEKHVGSFEAANTAAMGMGEIEDYDAYVRTKDGRAENVGGFLFNKISRSLNDKTQEDIDSEVIESIRNNRFTDRADQVLHFDGLMKAGYTHLDAINLAKDVGPAPSNTVDSVLAGMGINKAEEVLSEITPIKMTYYRRGEQQEIYVNRADYTRNGVLVKSVTMPLVNANGNIVNEDSYNFFMDIHNDAPENSNNTAVNNINLSQIVTPELLAEKLDPNNADGWYAAQPEKVKEIKSDDGYDRPGIRYRISYRNKKSTSPDPTIQFSRYIDEFDQPVLPSTPLSETASLEAGNALREIENILIIEGGEDNLQVANLVNTIFYQTQDNLEAALEADRNGTNATLGNNRKVLSRRIWEESEQLMEDSMGQFTREEALTLAGAAVVTPYSLAYQDEQIHNSRLINISNARNVALLIGEAQLTENTPGAWDGTPKPLYHQLAIGALDDVRNAMRGEDDTYQTLLVNQLKAMKGYEEILVPQTAMSPKLANDIQMSGRPVTTDGDFTFEQMLTFAAGIPAQQAAATEEENILVPGGGSGSRAISSNVIEDTTKQRLAELKSIERDWRGQARLNPDYPSMPTELIEELNELQTIVNDKTWDVILDKRDDFLTWIGEQKDLIAYKERDADPQNRWQRAQQPPK